MLGKIEDKRRRGQEDEIVGWHHRLDGHEFEQAPGVGRSEEHTSELQSHRFISYAVSEDEMVGWHHLLDGHEFKQTLGVGDG